MKLAAQFMNIGIFCFSYAILTQLLTIKSTLSNRYQTMLLLNKRAMVLNRLTDLHAH